MAKEGNDLLVYFAAHAFEQAVGFYLVDHQRILLFEVHGLNTLFQIIHGPQMLFPGIVDDGEGNIAFHSIAQFLTVSGQGLVQVHENIDPFSSVEEWYHYILDMSSLCLPDVPEHRYCLFSY